MSIKSDSKKKKSANPGKAKDMALFWRFASLIDIMISARSQDKLMIGTNTKRNSRIVNPASVRLKPKSKSSLAPISRRSGSWVKKTAIPLKIFNFNLQ